MKQVPVEQLRRRYEELGVSLQALLRLKALMGGLCRSLAFEAAVLAEVPPPGGTRWNRSDFLAAGHTLERLGLADAQGRCLAALEHDLACAAALDLRVTGTLARALESRATPQNALPLRFRLAVYTRDAESFAAAMEDAQRLMAGKNGFAPREHPFAGQFMDRLATPRPDGEKAWFASLPSPIRAGILANNLRPLVEEGRISPFLDIALEAAPDLRAAPPHVRLDPACLLFDVASGRFSEVAALVLPLSEDRQNEKGPLFSGMAALLEGRAAQALPLLREAQKRLRKRLGKRRACLAGAPGLCLGLALLLSRDPALHESLQELLDAALYPQSASRKGFLALSALLALVRGQPDVATGMVRRLRELPVREPLSEALAWAASLLIDRSGALARKAELEALFERYRQRLPFIAILLAETLLELSPEAAAAARFIRERPAPRLSLTGLVERRENWERVFDNLIRHLCPAAGEDAARGPRKGGPAAGKKRLIWLLDPATLEVEPVEQSGRAGGTWSRGRAASLKRLYEQAPELDWLDERDRRILGAVTWSYAWNGPSCGLRPEKALPLLVEHPLLFRAADRAPVTLTRKNVELVVRQIKGRDGENGGYALKLSHPYAGCAVSLERTGEAAYCLHEFSGRMGAAAALLGEGELRVPAEGAGRVLELLSGHDPAVPVRPEIEAEDITAPCSRPVVRLRPLGVGLEVRLVVRPFGPAGSPAFAPGEGNLEPLAEREGRPVRVRRDADAERAAARDLVRSCPTLRELGGCGPWLLDDVETALNCLLELQGSPSRPELEWPEGETLSVRPAVTAAAMRVQARRAADWFRLEGRIRVDEGLVLDMASVMERLEQARGCFIPLGDGAFLALTRQFKRQLERLRRVSEADGGGGRRVHPLGVGAVGEALAGAEEFTVDDAWQRHAARLEAAEAYVPRVPSALRAELRGYQEEGFMWMARLARWGAGACLADDMGLGKTVQTLAVMLDLAAEGPCLVVAPTSVCANWEAEILRFAPTLRVRRLDAAGHGTALRRRRAEAVRELAAGDVLVVTYGLLQTETAALAGRRWRIAVFDEAQALKNAETRRAKAARKITAGFRVALTGTPIENYLEDLWSLFHVINPGLLGTLPSFRKRFVFSSGPKAGGDGEERGTRRGGEARQALKALVRPFILRRSKSAVLAELPPRTEQILAVELPEEERAFYEALRRKALAALEQPDGKKASREEGQAARFTILAELTRLRRACCHPALIDPETTLRGAKLAAFMELVDDLARGGHRALVFSQFVGCLARVRRELDAAGVTYQYLDGSTPEKERRRAVEAFQAGEGTLFLVSLKAGGQGLNLTAADYVIHLDPWWNPAVEDQASDRAHRLGQERPVTVYRLVVRGSVEENILRLHRSKRLLAEDFLEGAEAPAGLSEAELLALIRAGTTAAGPESH